MQMRKVFHMDSMLSNTGCETMKKYEIYREEREKGLTYKQIAEKYGVSKQNVAQCCGKYNPNRFRFWTAELCVYPNVRNWLNENKISKAELIRRMGVRFHSNTNAVVRGYLKGKTYPPKQTIDKLLSITGLTYEEFFKADGQAGEKK